LCGRPRRAHAFFYAARSTDAADIFYRTKLRKRSPLGSEETLFSLLSSVQSLLILVWEHSPLRFPGIGVTPMMHERHRQDGNATVWRSRRTRLLELSTHFPNPPRQQSSNIFRLHTSKNNLVDDSYVVSI